MEAHDGQRIERDTVYVITPNTTLVVADGHLAVGTREPGAQAHMPIDDLFRSLAERRGRRAVGVILSGGGSDGTLGIAAIKSTGGITFAQELSSAKVDAMPRAALNSGFVDFSLPPTEIAREIGRIAAHPYVNGASAATDGPFTEEHWKRLFRMLRTFSGVDFSLYKRTTLRRRLTRRMALRRVEHADDYLTLLQDTPAELDGLYQDFLIRVTSFFRDPATFEGLATIVFPRIMQMRSASDPVRIWVPGCATRRRSLLDRHRAVRVPRERCGHRRRSRSSAPTSIHAPSIWRGLPAISTTSRRPSRRSACSVSSSCATGSYEVTKMIRDVCVFATHNLGRDPPFSNLALVSCRNVLIYLDPVLQKRVMGLFHYALNPERFLLLGPSETVGVANDLFELVDAKRKIYRRTGAGRRMIGQDRRDEPTAFKRPRASVGAGSQLLDLEHLQREADHLLLARFAPASVLIDDGLNVLQFRGQTGRFLEHQQGVASLNLNRLVRPELQVELSRAIDEARNTGKLVRKEGIGRAHARAEPIDIEVTPLNMRPEQGRCYLILFEAQSKPPEQAPAPTGGLLHRLTARRARHPDPNSPELKERDELQREVDATRTYLQAIMEANEAAQEELRTANEEVLSANEEFQSTNEELETAKEELQAANEELSTTNEELRHRNVELSQVNIELRKARDHSQAIVQTVRQPLVLLDADLRVRQANRAFHDTFAIANGDAEDALFLQLADGAWNTAGLGAALQRMLRDHVPFIAHDLTAHFPKIGERTLHIEARHLTGDVTQGTLLLLTLDDLTEQQRTARLLREQSELLEQAHDAVVVYELGGAIRYWNQAAATLYGWTAKEAHGQTSDLLLTTRRSVADPSFDATLRAQRRWSGLIRQTTRDGRELVIDAICTLVQPEGGSPVVLETARDVTGQVRYGGSVPPASAHIG